MSDLEKEFHAAVESAKTEIEAAQEKARAAVAEAVAVAEKYGIPFYGISDVTQRYTPESFEDKWGKLRDEPASEESEWCDNKLEELMDEVVGLSEGEYAGWAHSAIC